VVSNCANPACATPLRYLRDGRIYQFEVRSAPQTGTAVARKLGARRVWHFWLCGRCSSSLTLTFDQMEGLQIIPLHRAYSSAAV